MSLFPIVQPKLYPQNNELPLFREVAWDYQANTPIWQDGSPLMVEGAKAVAVWAYNALQTPRFRHEIYTFDYGNELDGIIGAVYSDDVRQAEAARFVRECLLICPYIQAVSDIKVSFSESHMAISCKLTTVYGEVKLNV